VTVPRRAASPAIPGLVLHFSSRLPEARHPARLPPQTKLEETVLDLADLAPTAEDAVAWPIRACQRRLTTPDRVIATLAARGRARWRRDIADAIPDIRAGAHSPLELRYARDVERRHGLPRGDRQATVTRGVSRQYVDVLYAGYGVVVELDGVLAHSADGKFRDARRDNANTLEGYQTLRYSWAPVAYHACATAIEVFSLLQRHGLCSPFRPCRACAAMTPGASCGPAPARRAARLRLREPPPVRFPGDHLGRLRPAPVGEHSGCFPPPGGKVRVVASSLGRLARMDPVTLIVAALGAGVASTLKNDRKGTVRAAMARLRTLAGKRLAERPGSELVLARYDEVPDVYEKPLEHELRESGAAADAELVGAAQELMRLLDARGAAAGKYVVTIQDSKGVQVGDHNTQVNHFGGVTAGRDAYYAARDMTIDRP
jgi:hypothetical protein